MTMATSDSKKNAATQSGGRVSKPVGKSQYMDKPARPARPTRPSLSTRPARPTAASSSTSGPTVTRTVIKTEPKVTTRIEKVSRNFTIYGNKDGAKVINERPAGYGDGNIGDDNSRIVQVTATPNSVAYNSDTGYATVKVTIKLAVWEKDYTGKKNRDYLSLSKQIQHSIFVGKGKSSEGIGAKNKDNTYNGYKYVEISATPFAPTSNHKYKTAIYKSYYHTNKGFVELYPGDFPEANVHQDWMAIQDIRVSANNDGSELYGTNNLAITGCFNFYFKVVTKTWKEMTEEFSTMDKPKATTVPGPHDVQPKEVIDSIREVVGKGYDITGGYTDTSSVKHPVLDLDKINNHKLLMVTQQRPSIKRYSITGESLEEFSSKLEKSLDVKVSFSGFGAAFSSDTQTTSSEEKHMSENRKFIKMTSILKNKEYNLLLDYRSNLNPDLLSPTFLNDLKTSDPTTIIDNYGTHIILGAVYGASASYNMSYVKSVSNITSARTFKNTTSIGYNSTGGTSGGTKKDENKKSAIAKLIDELGGIDNMSDAKFKEVMATYRHELDLQNKAKEASKTDSKSQNSDSKSSGSGSKTSGSGSKQPGGWGFSGETSYSESETTSNSFENSTTETNGIAFGGDWALSAAIKDGKLDKIPEWEISTDPRSNDPLINHQWCDFIPGKLVPIYEFVPAGCKVSAEKLRLEWTKHIDSKGKKLTPTKQSIITVPGGINITGNKECVQSLNSDREVDSQKNKATGWKVRFELVNLENGNVAVVVQLTVGEDGLGGNRTLMMLHYPIEVTNPNGGTTVIDTTLHNCSYETSGTIYRREHNMFDVTRFFLDCPFLNFIENPTNKVYIKIDGNGDDSSNIRIKVDNFYVPVLVDSEY